MNLEVSWHRGCGAAPLKCLELSLVFLSVRIQARCSLSLQVKAPTRQRRLGGSLVKDCKPDTSTVQSTAPGAIDRALDGPRMQTTRGSQGAIHGAIDRPSGCTLVQAYNHIWGRRWDHLFSGKTRVRGGQVFPEAYFVEIKEFCPQTSL